MSWTDGRFEKHSDRAPQFDQAMRELRIPLDHSLPGRPQTNSLAERNMQFILNVTCVLEAGTPACFWSHAIRCASHLLNVEHGDDDASSWCKLHGEEFKGEAIPFGANMFFKPNPVGRLIKAISLTRETSLESLQVTRSVPACVGLLGKIRRGR